MDSSRYAMCSGSITRTPSCVIVKYARRQIRYSSHNRAVQDPLPSIRCVAFVIFKLVFNLSLITAADNMHITHLRPHSCKFSHLTFYHTHRKRLYAKLLGEPLDNSPVPG